MADLHVELDVQWSPKQWDLITWQGARPELAAVLGRYGGGKTAGAAGRYLATTVLANPFVPGVHKPDDQPLSGIVGPTMASIYNGPLRELLRVADYRLIARKRLYGIYQDILWINGHLTKLYPIAGSIDGPSWCGECLDGTQRSADGQSDTNIISRVRDRRAQRLSITVSGIAQHGRVYDTFRKPDTARYRCWNLQPHDNPFMDAAALEELYASLPASELEVDEDGWAPPKDKVWPSFGGANILRDAPALDELRHIPVSLGADFGRRAAVVLMLPFRDGWLVVDQLCPENRSAEQIAGIVAGLGWKLDEKASRMCFDPTAAIDQVNHFRRTFPRVRVCIASSGFYLESENGRRAVNRAFEAGNGVRRLFIHPAVQTGPRRSERGVVETVRGYSELDLQDDKFEHMADALRYVVQEFIPLPLKEYGIHEVEESDATTSAFKPSTAGLVRDRSNPTNRF